MVMTHGDSFRRRPGLLERYMVEGGLRDVSIHIDTTQRGRLGTRWRAAGTEAELNDLRSEFADLVRQARARTGLPLALCHHRERRPATNSWRRRTSRAGLIQRRRRVTICPSRWRAGLRGTEDGSGGGVDVEVGVMPSPPVCLLDTATTNSSGGTSG